MRTIRVNIRALTVSLLIGGVTTVWNTAVRQNINQVAECSRRGSAKEVLSWSPFSFPFISTSAHTPMA